MKAGKRGGRPLGGWEAGKAGKAGKAGAVVFGLLLFAVPGCAGPRQNVDPEPVQADGFSLILNNHHLLDVNIFLLHDGQPDRIATVPSSTSRAIVLPLRMLGQSKAIRIIAEPIGDLTRYTTDLLVVQPGQIVELNVESAISRSSYSIQ
jgi:hypothetical protein